MAVKDAVGLTKPFFMILAFPAVLCYDEITAKKGGFSMRIAIVDDIASERETLADGIHVQLARISLDAAIFSFGSGADFLAAAVKERFDLVFLDIYMGNENGVNTAHALRRFDADCLLVFTTTSTDHALDAFRVRAFHYLVNPCTREDLDALFDEIAKRLPTDDRYIEVNAAGGSVRLHFREILYAEHHKHQIHIYRTCGPEIVTRQTFRDFSGYLTDGRFFRCSRGVIINMEHAEDFDGTDFILKNKMRVPVSRDLAKTARMAFGDFIFERRTVK